VVAGWFHHPTSRSNLFKKINYGRLGLPWQPGGHILQPFALFIYLSIYFLIIF